ncbi:MAG: hypothetical protein ACD_2C00153G0004 [uncultured bacterium (gcode 4)]|uniref:Uncharacterized protein n=1 Tax=uncultured bacterium (gcode 4) TaxID=1234023 RepID=K2G2V0_9BACT|nr:MAG: hypothetical protein ACD_2C00153G0004 [uncultured bacterium (gcode 4)]
MVVLMASFEYRGLYYTFLLIILIRMRIIAITRSACMNQPNVYDDTYPKIHKIMSIAAIVSNIDLK